MLQALASVSLAAAITNFASCTCNMLAHILALAAGFLALPGQSFLTRPPTTAPVDTIGDCASWAVAQPSDDCELLAKRNQVPLPQLLSYVRRLSPFDDQIGGFSSLNRH